MQKTRITVGTHEAMKKLGWKAAQAGLPCEPVVNPSYAMILSATAIEEMKESYAEGYAEFDVAAKAS